MGLSAAEKNRRKRERKKKEREERLKQEQVAKQQQAEEEEKKDGDDQDVTDVDIEYIAEPIVDATANNNDSSDNKNTSGLPDGVPQQQNGEKGNDDDDDQQDMASVLRRFQERASVVVSDDERKAIETAEEEEARKERRDRGEDDDEDNSDADYDSEEEERRRVSKRKLREMIRPSVAELKRRVKRPDLVEAHDVTAFDPDFLIQLKASPGTVPVPRHWGRKRKYLQGKRGFEKKPFELPDFIKTTGIAEVRDTLNEDENGMSAKQKNRSRVAPKMGAIDIDYRTLHDAFFKHQYKPPGLTKIGDMYYEGKEMETQTNINPGGPLSEALREALGMTSENSPPPWLNSMQRYGPPKSYPRLPIPGLNAPLPNDQCQYGYHPGGWGKPPVDQFGRPLYGGNPFDPPGSGTKEDRDAKLVTSHGKTLTKADWGALPEAGYEDAEESEEESSDDEMEESESEEEEGEEKAGDGGVESVLPAPPSMASGAPLDLRKQPGDETPMDSGPKQLYQVLPQSQANAEDGAVFSSTSQYVLPSQAAAGAASETPDGAASVLSKAVPENAKKKKKGDDDEDDLGKNFKF